MSAAAALPFVQQLELQVVEAVLPFMLMVGLMYVLLKKLPKIMEAMYRFTKTKTDYQCRCIRCQAERVRKMGRIGRWRQSIKNRDRFEREGV